MNNRTKIGMIAAVIVLVGMMVLLFSSSGRNTHKKNTFISSNWTNKYGLLDKKPYGLYLFTALTKAHIDSSNRVLVAHNVDIFDSILNTERNRTYFFTGKRFGLYSDEFAHLLDNVEEGSDLFLAYDAITENIEEKLFTRSNLEFDYTEKIKIETNRKEYSMIHLFQNDTIAKNWRGFGDLETFRPYESLSSFENIDNLIEIKHGKGKIILCTTPNVFYNYQLKRDDGYHYSQFVLNHLSKEKDIVYLEFGRLSEDYDDYEETDEGTDDSYLRLLFSNPTLLKAMLLSLLTMFLFAVFRSKRVRPIVPYLDKKKDMTLAFAETITSIYFSKRDPYTLLQVQGKNFFTMVQKHFYLDLNRGDRDNVLESLAEKSNYDVRDLVELLVLFETKTVSSVDEHYLAKVLGLQHEFYRKTGIISDKINNRTNNQKQVFRRGLLLPSSFILVGIFIMIIGLYFLMNSYGIGIALWPIGISLIFIGNIRLSNPYLVVENNIWTTFSPFGKKKEFKGKDIIEIELLNSGVVIHLPNQNKIIINYWELSRFDKEHFKRFITQIHTEE